jgi:hypothetical protein
MNINTPKSAIARSSKIYPEWYFGYGNKPSGNPGRNKFISLYSSSNAFSPRERNFLRAREKCDKISAPFIFTSFTLRAN